MVSWIVEALDQERIESARVEASRRLLYSALGLANNTEAEENLRFVAEAFDLAIADLLADEEQILQLRQLSAEAFVLFRALPLPEAPFDEAFHLLRMSCFGVIGERGTDASRALQERPWSPLPIDSADWGDRTQSVILDIWLRLIRKQGWEDLRLVQQRVVELREQQRNFEKTYLDNLGTVARTAAWKLVMFYHLSKAAEILAIYTSQGEVEGRYNVREQLDSQFDRALVACERVEMYEWHSITRLLAQTAQQLVENCIWTVTRAVNSRVTNFVTHLTNPDRQRPIFEVLPPQRRTLREQGLLGSGHRSVVVNLPTSSGKTFIAQFRILQALNQFDNEQGWVAYLAPTRALVNQVCTRLRRDFTSLGIVVERVSPALEIDGMEASLLTDKTADSKFRVLVTTPEKLDLLLRGGWEARIGRPLTLVVVDEAHNIAQNERGIKLELLLSTINRECRNAQFLLLTPFIPNPNEIARWLAPDSHSSIELGLDWQPNDRAVMLTRVNRLKDQGRGNFSIDLETLHTSRPALTIPESLNLTQGRVLGFSWSEIRNNKSRIAAVTADTLKRRGPVILLAGRVSLTWQIANYFRRQENKQNPASSEVALVQRYLASEFGPEFMLIDLLNYGVAVHHTGLSDEAKFLIEWLFEKGHLHILVATTTIAQGVNFPVSGVVLATHQYPYGQPMPPEDFWNLAGRSGRIEQSSLGIVALASTSQEDANTLRQFVTEQVTDLNSVLIDMVQKAMNTGNILNLHKLFHEPAWSTFLQYLAHTYLQVGGAESFTNEIEQILRGTFGFQHLRRLYPSIARQLVSGVRRYGQRIAGKPVSLVDSTGFSWESISITLGKLAEERITEDIWDTNTLFTAGNRNLSRILGILFEVPELRENLTSVINPGHDSERLANLVRDWVNGVSLQDIAQSYFNIDARGQAIDPTNAMTACCRSIFGRLTQTTSWGLAALQTMTFRERFDNLSLSEQQALRNLPARVFYGVNSDDAIALRLLGVPRSAAEPLASTLRNEIRENTLPRLRSIMTGIPEKTWSDVLGNKGSDYYKVWRILEGLS